MSVSISCGTVALHGPYDGFLICGVHTNNTTS